MLQKLADAMGETNHSAESHAMADLRFHLAVAEASRNPFMRSVGSLIEAALVGVFKLSSPSADLREIQNARATHRCIVDAIRNRDVEEARAAMEAVIINGVERVRLALRTAD
jgi:DNA-binding FadR family transcriptional regulator